MKFVWFWYVIAALVFVAGVVLFNEYPWFEGKPAWLMAIPLVLFLVPIRKHIATRLVKLTLSTDHLTYERGVLSKYTRTVDVVKVQDVTVRQTIMQRIFGIGDLSMESAGESGMITITGIDSPRSLADTILHASKKYSAGGQGVR
jgi:putative membrane protein